MLHLTETERIGRHFRASKALSAVRLAPAASRDPDALGELEHLAAMRALVSDVSLSSHPPFCAVVDILNIIFHRDEVTAAERGPDPDLARRYLLGAVIPWLRDDPSVEALFQVARRRRGVIRARFLPFLAREIGRALAERCTFQVRVDTPRLPERLTDENGPLDRDALGFERDALEALVESRRGAERLFSAEQVSRLTYVRDEADLLPLHAYTTVRSILGPVSLKAAQRSRNAHYDYREVQDENCPSMGGYSGLRSGGSIEQIHAILPSELAQMESGSRLDLFDLNMAEKRLLYFERDRRIDIRRRREYHVVFTDPVGLDYRPCLVPVRWPYLVLGALLDVIRFYRDELAVTHCPFRFVFQGERAQTRRFRRLIGAVRAQDFTDVSVKSLTVPPGGVEAYLAEAAVRGEEDSVVLLVTPSLCDEIETPEGFARVRLSLSTDGTTDLITVDDGQLTEIPVATEDALVGALNRFRNLLATSLIGARAPKRS